MERDGLNDSAPFNKWFDQQFPKAVEVYGAGILEGRYEDQYGDTKFIPVALNENAWAAGLGEKLRLVYFPQESQFYFFDPQACEDGAFVSTSEEKVEMVVSSYLMRCAQACPPLVDVDPLVVKFRKADTLEVITEKAKVILACAGDFFQGAKGQRRIVKGKLIEPNAEPAYAQFVRKMLVLQPEARLTIQEAFSCYYQFCKASGEPPLTRGDFKELVAEVIREEFNLGMRHDVRDGAGVARHGWVGIGYSRGQN